MQVRLALEDEEDQIVEMACQAMATRPELAFDEARCRETFRDYLNKASPTIWVAEDHRGIAGALAADFYLHRAASGLFVVQEVLFVKPERRGGRAAASLMKTLIDWSREIGATEIVGGNDNEFNSERTAKFLGRFRFRRVGHAMRRTL